MRILSQYIELALEDRIEAKAHGAKKLNTRS
jgi:hypothetical protein